MCFVCVYVCVCACVCVCVCVFCVFVQAHMQLRVKSHKPQACSAPDFSDTKMVAFVDVG